MERRRFITAAVAGIAGTSLVEQQSSASENAAHTKRSQVYQCEECDNIVQVVHPGIEKLVCCKKPMKLLVPKTADKGLEKHVPVLEKIDGGFKVKVGEIPHPMIEDHYIEWIDLHADGIVYRHFLKPGTPPEATFMIDAKEVTAQAFCNLHSLWEGK